MNKCPICKKDFTRKGRGPIGKFCSRHCKEKNKAKRYIQFRKEHCEFCGFIPVHMCQLDVDHKDGNRDNNSESNLQTLCSNCHRLKTYLNRDWKK